MKQISILLLAWPLAAPASEMVYTPINPNFGGNPMNGSMLMGQAQAQDSFKDPDARPAGGGLTQQTDLERFNDMLQRAVLGRLATSVSNNLFGPNGQLVPGTVETGDFVINIVDIGNGLLQITTTDKATGQSTSFQITNQI